MSVSNASSTSSYATAAIRAPAPNAIARPIQRLPGRATAIAAPTQSEPAVTRPQSAASSTRGLYASSSVSWR